MLAKNRYSLFLIAEFLGTILQKQPINFRATGNLSRHLYCAIRIKNRPLCVY